MADLIEEEISKIGKINGNLLIDMALVVKLTEGTMILLTTFEGGERLTKIVKSIITIIEKSKENIFKKEQKAMQGPIRTCLQGLNMKLSEADLDLRVRL